MRAWVGSTLVALLVGNGSGEAIEWSVPNLFRLAALVAAAACLLNFAVMMSHYWNRVVPLRKEVGEGKIIAPPVIWTFAYHSIVAAIALYIFAAQFIALARSAGPVAKQVPVSPLTFVTVFLMLALNFVVSQFSRYYSRNLDAAVWKQRLGESPGEDTSNSDEG